MFYRMPKILALLIVALGLTGCSGGMTTVMKNRDCTTKVNGEVAFGSITPTGKVRFSAVCKPGAQPSSAEVPAPAAPEDVKTPS